MFVNSGWKSHQNYSASFCGTMASSSKLKRNINRINLVVCSIFEHMIALRVTPIYMTYIWTTPIFSFTLDRVSKGVRELPGSFNSATSSVPSGKSLMYFGFFLATGIFFIFIAFTIFLPVMVLKPQKFAICFTIGCAFIVGSFFALKGPKNQLLHMFSKEVFPISREFLYLIFPGSTSIVFLCTFMLYKFNISFFFRDFLLHWDF